MGSDNSGRSLAIAYTLIETAKLNSVDPQAWLTDVLSGIADHKINRMTSCCLGGILRLAKWVRLSDAHQSAQFI
jgi:hypothetical protein